MRHALLLAIPLLLAACATETEVDVPADDPTAETDPMPAEDPVQPAATVTLAPLGDSGVSGNVTFTPTDGGLQVTYAIEGLTPGPHGFHVHENGDCGPGPDGAAGGAAGEHYAPMESPHGAQADPTGDRHVGDFGNVEAGADGRAAGTFVDAVAMLDGAQSIVGKAVLVHAGEDDLTTQPSGASGDRVACGVVMAGAMGMTDGALPPGHPPIDALPPGHPPIDGAPAEGPPAEGQ